VTVLSTSTRRLDSEEFQANKDRRFRIYRPNLLLGHQEPLSSRPGTKKGKETTVSGANCVYLNHGMGTVIPSGQRNPLGSIEHQSLKRIRFLRVG
jgi:hypothetical protein